MSRLNRIEGIYYNHYQQRYGVHQIPEIKDMFINAHQDLEKKRFVGASDIEATMREMASLSYYGGLRAKAWGEPISTAYHTFGSMYRPIEHIVPDMPAVLEETAKVSKMKNDHPFRTWRSIPISFERYGTKGNFIELVNLPWESDAAELLKAAGRLVGFDVRPFASSWLDDVA